MYSPKYVDLSDVPMAGVDDDYEADTKQDALEHAESRLEAVINEGRPISDSELQPAHRTAVKALATHVLTLEAEDVTSTKLGDLTSGGEQVVGFSTEWLNMYEQMRDSIQAAESDEGTDSRTGSVFTTSG